MAQEGHLCQMCWVYLGSCSTKFSQALELRTSEDDGSKMKQVKRDDTWGHSVVKSVVIAEWNGMDFPDFGLPLDFRSRKLARPDSRTCFLSKEMGDPVSQNLMSL